MTWWILLALNGGLVASLAIVVARRRQLRDLRTHVSERGEARRRGTHAARLQYPYVDLTRCIGCGLCIEACPEEGVLGMIHGQAVVVHGARCVSHGRCAEACPVAGIALTFADMTKRRDLPAIDERFEVIGRPGMFLAGEITGYALIRTAIGHGTAVAQEVARRVKRGAGASAVRNADDKRPFDLCIVGAGPAGLACSLEAKSQGLHFVTIDQESLGGTVAKYPRRKVVMTQPVRLPLVGQLNNTSFSKEELMELWERVTQEHKLPLLCDTPFTQVELSADGVYLITTPSGVIAARHVCLALGRRGSPRKLGVPGESLGKVSYSLLDAQSYTERRILVVGGGDSAVEAAVGLAEQPGNQVTLSYRKNAFSRLKLRNERRLHTLCSDGCIVLALDSDVRAIEAERVLLEIRGPGAAREEWLDNDEVFIFAGGTPPFELLEKAGVSFDPEQRPPVPVAAERGPGIVIALVTSLMLALAVVTWAWWHYGYYSLDAAGRVSSSLHSWLRSSGPIGLGAGVMACALMVWNLAFLIRRSRLGTRWPGSLSLWMSSHVLTGILALLTVLVHAAFAPRATIGGHALLALVIVVAAGAIGRYLYAFVPRAANGRELALDEVEAQLTSISGDWDREGGDFGERVRATAMDLAERDRWKSTFIARLYALVTSQRRVHRALARLRQEGSELGYVESELDRMFTLARRAHRVALSAAHFEDLRALLGAWRYVHRWLALFMVLVVILHIVIAVRYADFGWLTEWFTDEG